MLGEYGLVDRVRKFIQVYCVHRPSKDWTVALSGGVDSMVLLHLLTKVAPEAGARLRAVHINHGLRSESKRDETFVQNVCADMGVPIDVRSIDMRSVPVYQHKGVEADGRRLRYQAIVESARQWACSSNAGLESGLEPLVFLGHHADDQVETVLMRLIRGTSTTGLAGIRPERDWQGMLWMRPFLGVPKSELVSYAADHGITFVQDDTNFDTYYTRNFLRHEIVPKLIQIQPNLTEAVRRLTDVLQAEDDFLESVSREHFRALVKQEEGVLTLDNKEFMTIPLPLQRRVIKIILYCLTPADWTFDHMDSILRLCGQSVPSGVLHLPNRTLVRKVYSQVQFMRLTVSADGASASEVYRTFWEINENPMCHVHAGEHDEIWRFRRFPYKAVGDIRRLLGVNKYEAVFPRLTGFVIQPAPKGERMKVFGLGGSKKVQDLFVDLKIPRHLRGTWPCVYVDGEVVWIPGLARSESYLLDEGEDGWRVVAEPARAAIDAEAGLNVVGPFARNHRIIDDTT
ncbi:tRNA lysidine(34) synthetase TilS [Alicyclobacillus mengziensis]|uniref:tRNA(Ile)-lysidine synthase n=1 Tax=Alicyclobacillus mengziensis TaxID=2931921 RepID=A0A9X7W009_9BACL|nr:tRNA lysidine(34) synthetase TilS [Alicyclobacillus mengziensis]QSO47950.1 tRNA lysidine(34) synthetase TilS [Alicyclobacillus mengziensis]